MKESKSEKPTVMISWPSEADMRDALDPYGPHARGCPGDPQCWGECLD